MDEFARSAPSREDALADSPRIDALTRENQRLRDALAALQSLQQMTAHPPGIVEPQNLRDANERLVQATLGAQNTSSAAQSLNRRQMIFLSMLAHELRNPLAPIAAANTLLDGLGAVHPLLPKLSAVLHRQVDQLVHLVDDLLDVSRIASGKISLQKRKVALRDVIDSAIEAVQPAFNMRGQQVCVGVSPATLLLDADPVRLAQLLTNLLVNASKFSGANATIWLSAMLQDGYVVVSVRDQGAGIAPALLPHVFDLFTQGEQTLDRATGGLGIGLALVRTIAEMHGGAVTVASDGPGCGSEFRVALPLPAPALGPAPGTALSACATPR
ncbi:MAG: HAMP domain-containing sensor histidine kinase [Pseudomonadota bacterium]|nr:HAMP domain-containing sensor histidine kinase [Pseudomonadota bacterium]